MEVESEGDRPWSPCPPSCHSPDHSHSSGEDETSGGDPSDDVREGGEDSRPLPEETVPSPTSHPSARGVPSASAQALAPPTGQSASALPSVAPPKCSRDDPASTLGFPFSQYGSNLCEGPGSLDIPGLFPTVLGPLPSPQSATE